MSVAGYTVSLKQSGVGVASTGEATSAVSGSTRTYVITSTAKRVWDRDVAPVAYSSSGVGALAQSSTGKTDYVFGKVILAATHGGTITLDVTYLPMTVIAGAHTYNLNLTSDLLDDTDFSSTGWRSKAIGLRDATLTASKWTNLANSDMRFYQALTNPISGSTLGKPAIVAEIVLGSSAQIFRGFFRVESESRAGSVSDLESGDLSLVLDSSTKKDMGFSDI